MKIFAHRGLVFEYPENTLVSFEESLKRGFGLELDIHRTKDGKIVIMHDSNTKMFTGYNYYIPETDWQILKELDCGSHFNKKFSDQKIPLLTEVFDLFRKYNPKNQEIAVQLKDNTEKNIVNLISELLLNYNKKHPKFKLFRKIFIFDTTVSNAKKLKKWCPELRVSLSIGETKNFPNKRYPTIYTYDEVKEETCWDMVWADEWEEGLYSKEFVNVVHNDNKSIQIISPELHIETNPKHPLSEKGYENLWKRIITWHADGICTNYPDKFKRILEKIR